MKNSKLHASISAYLCGAFLFCLVPNWVIAQVSAPEPLRLLPSEPPTEESSYEARHINRRGVKDVDPNVYVYTPEFAKRFQMPMQWASEELKGADAVAFRVMPHYKSCGWGGNPNACRNDEVRCYMDVYFDHKNNPLPWDERMPMIELHSSMTSRFFIGNSANRRVRFESSLPGGRYLPREPFTDPKSGKELGWQSWHGASVGGWIGIVSYDREIFQRLSIVTLGASCTSPAMELWLASAGLSKRDVPSSKSLSHLVILPPTWQARAKQALADSDERSKAFFKQQGEQALKALQTTPPPNNTITPIE